MDDFHSVWREVVEKTAYFVARDFPDVDALDLEQEMYLWLWEKEKFQSPDEAGVSTALYWLGERVASDYRKQHLSLSAQYSYKTSDVKQILVSIFSVEDWVGAFIPEDAMDGDHFGDKLSVYSDVSWAYDLLPQAYKQSIWSRYHDGIEYESDSTGRRTLNRAVEKLTDILNTYSRGDRRRTAITNAEAGFKIAEANGDLSNRRHKADFWNY